MMIRFLASMVLGMLGNAVGLLAASVLLEDFQVQASGFVASVLFYSVAVIILGPFVLKMSLRYVPALSGGIALVTSFVGLILASLFTNGLSITGLSTWIMAPLIVWVCTLIAGVVLPLFLFKKTLGKTRTPDNPNNRIAV